MPTVAQTGMPRESLCTGRLLLRRWQRRRKGWRSGKLLEVAVQVRGLQRAAAAPPPPSDGHDTYGRGTGCSRYDQNGATAP